MKDLGTIDGVARDLRESPAMFELDLQGVPDGGYQLNIDVTDSARALGGASLAIAVRKGLDDLVSRLEADAKHAPEALRADILFPIDRMRNVNRGRLELRTFDPDQDFADAEAIAAAVRAGQESVCRAHRRLQAPLRRWNRPARSCPTACTCRRVTRRARRALPSRSSSRCTASAAPRTRSSPATTASPRSSPSSTATSSRRRSATASTDRTAGDSATLRPIRTRGGCRNGARKT